MSEPKEYQSIDDLFRHTFETAPETPAPSGWDTPSPAVWDHISRQVQPAGSQGLSVYARWIGGFMLASVAALSVYLWLRPEAAPSAEPQPILQPAPPTAAAAPTEQTASSPTAPRALAPAAPAPSNRQTSDLSRQYESIRQSAAARRADVFVEPKAAAPTPREVAGTARPLPGAAPEFPNHELKKQYESLRLDIWRKPFDPLPGPMERRQIPYR